MGFINLNVFLVHFGEKLTEPSFYYLHVLVLSAIVSGLDDF
jgi:hypothetical protein